MKLTEANVQMLPPNQDRMGRPLSISQSSSSKSRHSDTDCDTFRPYKRMVANEIIHLYKYQPEGIEAIKRSGLKLRTPIEPVMKDGSVIPDDNPFWKATWGRLCDMRFEILGKRGVKIHDSVELLEPAAKKIKDWIPMPPDDGRADDQNPTDDITPVSPEGRLYMGSADKENEEKDQEETIHSKVDIATPTSKRKRHDPSEASVTTLKKRKLNGYPLSDEQTYHNLETRTQASSSSRGKQPRGQREVTSKINRSSPRSTTKAAVQPGSRQRGVQPVRRSARIAARTAQHDNLHGVCRAGRG